VHPSISYHLAQARLAAPGDQARRAYPSNAPAYYLGRPAEWWTTALSAHRRSRAAAPGLQRQGAAVNDLTHHTGTA
jgi:hypothetical protein